MIRLPSSTLIVVPVPDRRPFNSRFVVPFTSRFKLASGAKATKAQQQRVEGDCPQATVGLFGTPIDKVDDALFERAVTEFVSCMPARHDLLLERADRRVVRPAHDRSPSKQIAPLIA